MRHFCFIGLAYELVSLFNLEQLIVVALAHDCVAKPVMKTSV